MAKVINNVVKCYGCGSYIKYNESDINTEERCYGIMSYVGETYKAKVIVCPKCGKKIEVN